MSEKVFCLTCKFYCVTKFAELCKAPKNMRDTYLWPKQKYISPPDVRNTNNTCELFEVKYVQ